MPDTCFVKEAQKITDSGEMLNWYRNLYYKEQPDTERGIMARAVNDILPKYVLQQSRIAELEEQLEVTALEKKRYIQLWQMGLDDKAFAHTSLVKALQDVSAKLKNYVIGNVPHYWPAICQEIDGIIGDYVEEDKN